MQLDARYQSARCEALPEQPLERRGGGESIDDVRDTLSPDLREAGPCDRVDRSLRVEDVASRAASQALVLIEASIGGHNVGERVADEERSVGRVRQVVEE